MIHALITTGKVLFAYLVIVTLVGSAFFTFDMIQRQSESYVLDGKGPRIGAEESYVCRGWKGDRYCSFDKLVQEGLLIIPVSLVIAIFYLSPGGLFFGIPYNIASYLLLIGLFYYFIKKDMEKGKKKHKT